METAPDGSRDLTDCSALIGMTEEELSRHLGRSATRRAAGSDTWLVFDFPDLSVRVRCTGGETARVASWTASFSVGHARLRDAASAVGLWPAAEPDEEAARCELPLIRRPFRYAGSGLVHSLTATVRQGLVTAISVFDEAPDWL